MEWFEGGEIMLKFNKSHQEGYSTKMERIQLLLQESLLSKHWYLYVIEFKVTFAIRQ